MAFKGKFPDAKPGNTKDRGEDKNMLISVSHEDGTLLSRELASCPLSPRRCSLSLTLHQQHGLFTNTEHGRGQRRGLQKIGWC